MVRAANKTHYMHRGEGELSDLKWRNKLMDLPITQGAP